MSYEGRRQVIYADGTYDVYKEDHRGNICLGAPIIWSNEIDDTNCESYGEVRYEDLVKFYLKEKEVVQTCNLGHEHVISESKFRCPGDEVKYLGMCNPRCDGETLVPIYSELYKHFCDRLANGEVFGS